MSDPKRESTPADEGRLKAPVRVRRLQVGQCWGAVFVDDVSRMTGYTFKLVHEDTYWDQDTETNRKFWLGVKLYVRRDPHGEDISQCWWFDDRGTCTDSTGGFGFWLTRKRHNAGGNGPSGVAAKVRVD